MINPSFKNVLKEGDSRYTMVMLTAKELAKLLMELNPL